MFIAVISIIIFISVLLVLVVLAQNPKGGGLSNQFGGSGTSQLMGVKRTGDLLEKLTWGLAIALVILTLSSHAMMGTGDDTGAVRSINQQRAQGESVPAPAPQQTIPSAPNTADPNNATIPDAADIPAMTDDSAAE